MTGRGGSKSRKMYGWGRVKTARKAQSWPQIGAVWRRSLPAENREGGLFFTGFGAVAGTVDDQARQINKYKDIDGEQTDANPRDAADDLEDFPRQKGSGDGEREEFAPRLFQIKADALGEGYCCVAESRQGDLMERALVNERGFLKEEIDQP